MNISLTAATRSVYFLCEAPNGVVYSMHRQTLEKAELVCCDLQVLKSFNYKL